MNLFQGANNVLISGRASFTHIGGDYRVECRSDFDAVMAILSQHVAPGATFDSAERFPPGKCHPGTREAIMKILMDWIDDPMPRFDVVWLYGPAGSGKSAIAQSIAELLWWHHRDKYGGSFFFARNVNGRGDGGKLFSTLAYQLATYFPSIRPLINDALCADPTLPAKSIDVQIRALFIDPLLHATDWPTHTPTIIIDGLDECTGSNTQLDILNLISQSVVEHRIPLRFLVDSRSEYWIQDAFKTGPLSAATGVLSLYDAGDANKDIEKYLVEQFAQIHKKYGRVMSSVEQPWPPAHVIERFVIEASGQFIYASTLVKFVGYTSDYCDPREQLSILLTSGPHRATAFSDLDTLYETILLQLPHQRRATLRLLLGAVSLRIDVKVLEIFVSVNAGEISLVLSALSPLINIEPESDQHSEMVTNIFGSSLIKSERIWFCHLSFQEFLEDESRSGQFFVNAAQIADELVNALFQLIIDTLQQRSIIEQHKSCATRIEVYRVMVSDMIIACFSKCDPETLSTLLYNLNQSLEAFLAANYRCVLYPKYLMQYLDRIEKMYNFLTDSGSGIRVPFNLHENVTCAGVKIVQYLWETGSLSPTPEVVYTYLSRGSYVNGLDELPQDLLSQSDAEPLGSIWNVVGIRWEPRRGSREAYMSTFRPLHNYFLRCGTESPIQWTSQATRLAYLCLISLCADADTSADNEERHIAGYLLQNKPVSIRWRLVDRYLQDPTFSSITNVLRSPFGTLFLKLLTDFSSLDIFLSYQKQDYFNWSYETDYKRASATHVVLWMHRLLKSQNSRLLMAQHNESLLKGILQIIETLFQGYFLPDYMLEVPGNVSDIWFHNKHDAGRSIAMQILPSQGGGSNNGIRIEEKDVMWVEISSLHKHGYSSRVLLCEFHEQVFGFPEHQHPDIDSIIKRTDWYPHLATYLLIAQVQHQYHWLNPEFEGCSYKIRESFRYIVQCFPYAYPTERNVVALRALRYLSPKLTPPWRPPSGFCGAVTGFLKRYDSTIIPSREFNDMIEWLTSLREEGNEVSDDSEEDSDPDGGVEKTSMN